MVGRALDVTYADLEKASVVLLAGLEPEDESPIVFLRLRKAARRHGTKVVSIAPFTSRGLQKMHGTLVRTAPGDEPAALEALANDGEVALDGGGVILVGERLATVPGALSAALAPGRHHRRPARLGAAPCRRAGCAGDRLPAQPAARRPSGRRRRRPGRPRHGVGQHRARTTPGRDGDAILAAAAAGELTALVVGGVDPVDLPDPAAAARRARDGRLRGQPRGPRQRGHRRPPTWSSRSPRSPRRPACSWTGRAGSGPSTRCSASRNALPDLRVLAGIADELGVDLGFKTVEQARAEMQELGAWDGAAGRVRRRACHAARASPPTPPTTTGCGWRPGSC